MIGIYFSGIGNTKYCVETFLQKFGATKGSFSIEDSQAIVKIQQAEEIVFGYSVQFSNLPKMVKDFVTTNSDLWKGKKVYIIATMGMFSGDGTGMLARLLEKHGAIITGGLHIKMPNSISDDKLLRPTVEENQKTLKKAVEKIEAAVEKKKKGISNREGLGFWYHMAGLFGQRLYFYNKTTNYSSQLKIDQEACIGCGKCVTLCPMNNITMKQHKAIGGNQCTMCYRCINNCPQKAMTLLGKKVLEQINLEGYL